MNDEVKKYNPNDPAITLTEAALKQVQSYIAKQGHGVGLRYLSRPQDALGMLMCWISLMKLSKAISAAKLPIPFQFMLNPRPSIWFVVLRLIT